MNPELRAALLAQVEARQALNALADDCTPEDRAAAVTALNDADQAVAELLALPEQTAPAELRDRISLARYLVGCAEQRSLDGAEGELRAELKLSDQAVPLEALLPTPEERADAISPQDAAGQPLASGAINLSTGPMLERIFTQTDTAFLGVGMPMVPAGERRYPVMVGGTSAAMQARGGEPDAGAAKFSVVDANPHRLTGRYVLDLEGVAEMGGMLESTLRADLRREMGFQLDNQVLNGDGQGANVSGILHALDDEAFPALSGGAKDPAQLTWENARQMLYTLLDGKYARMESDVRLLIGDSTYNRLRNVYRSGASASNVDGIDALRAMGAAVRRSFLIPPQSAYLPSATKREQHVVWAAEPMAAVAPVWQGITMIRDPYTNAGKAQIVLTAHMLFDFIFRRKDGWKDLAVNPLDTAK
ncbi:MAG: phage major capsid protein [Deltaproteobacteria bacterium]|nr:phage major capsid protein [Deltaproteobacteria bacterium]